MAKMTMAVVGCGGMGGYHLSELRAMDEFDIVAVCDVVPELLNKRADDFNIPHRYHDLHAMLEEIRPDVVSVPTQVRQHRDIVVACAEAKVKGILCEKPMALDLAECDEMIEACHKNGASLAINHQGHCSPATQMALNMVERGDIGDLLLIRGLNKGQRLAGCELMEFGTHTADRMMVFGGQPQWCSAYIEVDGRTANAGDIMSAREMNPGERDAGLVMGKHAFAHYGFSNCPLGEQYFMAWEERHEPGVDVIGTKGTLRVGNADTEAPLYYLPFPVLSAGRDADEWQRLDPPPPRDAKEASLICVMYQHLIHTMETGEEHPVSGEVGRQTMEMTMAIYESHWRQARVSLPLPERRHPLERWRESAAGTEEAKG